MKESFATVRFLQPSTKITLGNDSCEIRERIDFKDISSSMTTKSKLKLDGNSS
jgi:hypothetical protein